MKATLKLNRTQWMDIAKILRNTPINNNNRVLLAREFAKYLRSHDSFFDYKRFLAIASGDLETDFKTECYSTYKGTENEQGTEV